MKKVYVTAGLIASLGTLDLLRVALENVEHVDSLPLEVTIRYLLGLIGTACFALIMFDLADKLPHLNAPVSEEVGEKTLSDFQKQTLAVEAAIAKMTDEESGD